MKYLAILLFVGLMVVSPITGIAGHDCGGVGGGHGHGGHGGPGNGGNGNGHGGGGDSNGGTGGSGGNGGTSGGSVGASGSGPDGGGDGLGFEVNQSASRCTVVEWWSNGFECPEPMPYIPASDAEFIESMKK